LALHGSYINVPLAGLAAVLWQLPALNHLALGEPMPFRSSVNAIGKWTHGVEAATELLQAVDKLRKLSTVRVSLPLKLASHATSDRALQLERQLAQVLGNQLSRHCSVRVCDSSFCDTCHPEIHTGYRVAAG
jgi:hypothetical protein